LKLLTQHHRTRYIHSLKKPPSTLTFFPETHTNNKPKNGTKTKTNKLLISQEPKYNKINQRRKDKYKPETNNTITTNHTSKEKEKRKVN